MATLLKFKLLATHCGVAQSPTRSPRTSPVVHIRRRKTTLRMLLNRSSGRWSSKRRDSLEKKNENNSVQRNTLEDLFVSSPPYEEIMEKTLTVTRQVFGSVGDGVSNAGSIGWRRSEPGSPRAGWSSFRSYRFLLRKAWRPVLLTIPE